MKKRGTRENLALMLAPDLREVARLISEARQKLADEGDRAYAVVSSPVRTAAMSDLDAALDLLLGKNRHR